MTWAVNVTCGENNIRRYYYFRDIMKISHLVELDIDGRLIDYNVCPVCEDMSWTEVPQVMVEWRGFCCGSDKQSGTKQVFPK
jgi:hypothetical protein